jgi:hypothetical protein
VSGWCRSNIDASTMQQAGLAAVGTRVDALEEHIRQPGDPQGAAVGAELLMEIEGAVGAELLRRSQAMDGMSLADLLGEGDGVSLAGLLGGDQSEDD